MLLPLYVLCSKICNKKLKVSSLHIVPKSIEYFYTRASILFDCTMWAYTQECTSVAYSNVTVNHCDRCATTSYFRSTHFLKWIMAELNRQLQEYLAQSKSGAKTISQSSSSTAIDIDEPTSVPGSWFGRWSGPFSGTSNVSRGASTGQTVSSFSWPWSSESDPCLPGMSRSQRLIAFALCIFFSALCFGLSALYAPLLLLKARKFALLWSLGSVFALLGAAILRGPSKLIAAPTLGASVYLCSLVGTLYAALNLHSTLLTALGAGLQITAIVGYIVALLPGGSAGLRFVGGMAASAIKRTVTGKAMPIWSGISRTDKTFFYIMEDTV